MYSVLHFKKRMICDFSYLHLNKIIVFELRIRTRSAHVNKVLQWTFIVARCNDPYRFKHESRNRPASHVRPPFTGYEMLGYWVTAYTIWPTWSGSHYVCACVC